MVFYIFSKLHSVSCSVIHNTSFPVLYVWYYMLRVRARHSSRWNSFAAVPSINDYNDRKGRWKRLRESAHAPARLNDSFFLTWLLLLPKPGRNRAAAPLLVIIFLLMRWRWSSINNKSDRIFKKKIYLFDNSSAARALGLFEEFEFIKKKVFIYIFFFQKEVVDGGDL